MTPGELLRMQLEGNSLGALTVVAVILLCVIFAGWD